MVVQEQRVLNRGVDKPKEEIKVPDENKKIKDEKETSQIPEKNNQKRKVQNCCVLIIFILIITIMIGYYPIYYLMKVWMEIELQEIK